MCRVREREGLCRDKCELFARVIVWMVTSPVELEKAGVPILDKRTVSSIRASKI